MTKAPFGSWTSPISAAQIAQGGVTLQGAAAVPGGVLWLEMRPAEGGRSVLVFRDEAGAERDVTPQGFNVRTQVHEYGGGAWWVNGTTIFFANWADQRLYRQELDGDPVAITPEPEIPRSLRYADGIAVHDDSLIFCVRERHVEGREAFNEIVKIDGDDIEILCSGNDFYSNPRVGPGGSLVWLEWPHPNLPWDGTFLMKNGELIAGAMDEAIFQPSCSPDGVLHYVSDRTGWWNIYREGEDEPIVAMDADFGAPSWGFATTRYVFLDTGDIIAIATQDATDTLGIIRAGSRTFEPFDLPYTTIGGLSRSEKGVYFLGASPTEYQQLVEFDPGGRLLDVIKMSRSNDVDEAYLSVAEPIDYPSEGRTAHAFYYAPKNKDFEGTDGERPPLIVFSHGGPTGNVNSSLNLSMQFWTSRGFAVVDVNYGGSTGYGRDYRRLLNGNWGVVDVEDCVNAARYLADRGDADGDRLAIRGGSAGGFTTLAALVFADVFKAGANYYGVSDFTPFVEDTHKFESRYLDSLVGPYPQEKQLYYDRSPANFVDRISAPVITFQGTEDMIVPPSQSERVVNALREKKIPCAYVTYEGEQHGFRKAENIIHSLETELYFYGKVFGFSPADDIEGVPIENL